MKYEIKGGDLPVVICQLDAGETIVTESGSMSWMDSNVEMDTKGGGVGKVFGRMFAGESLFRNEYTAVGRPGSIAFASSFPGSIMAVELQPGKEVIVQKKAFLAGEQGVNQDIYFQKKFGAGFFGGEGFVMQKLSGKGIAFVEIDGEAIEYHLEAGQSMIINSGYLAMMDSTCTMDVQTVKGVKNMFLGGEGIFNTVVKGPGNIVIQTMPVHKLAQAIIPYIPMPSDK
ncbi:MAG: TIGR00266 family protein [Firmicutes bacterium]|nr:TIGR00266 family protein [Bacillota bacterium]